MTWIIDALRGSRATWKIIANQVTMSHDPTGGGPAVDAWDEAVTVLWTLIGFETFDSLAGPERSLVSTGSRTEDDEVEVVGRADGHGSERQWARWRQAPDPAGQMGHRVRW